MGTARFRPHPLRRALAPLAALIAAGAAVPVLVAAAPAGATRSPAAPVRARAAAPPARPSVPAAPAVAPVEQGERRASALLLIERPVRLSADSVVGEYLFRWRAPARAMSARPERLLLDLGDALGIIHASQEPVASWVVDKAVRASWQWAGAGVVSRRHRAHLQVEVRSPRGDAVTNARRLTNLVGALIPTLPIMAVLWNDAGMLLSPTKFLVDSEAIGPHGIPTGLWLNVLPAALSPHLPVMHTMGLRPLGFRELILYGHRAGPEQSLETLLRIAEQVLQGRLTLRRGDTFRTGSRETLEVHEIPAPWNAQEVAFQLTPRTTTRRR
jgi:hypothetical protein